MLSFLISVFNVDCSQLVHDLAFQCKQMKLRLRDGFDYEIIVGDDASTDHRLTSTNQHACSAHEGCIYFPAQCNMGLAAMRNCLADKAIYPYLVFIDSDAAVCSDQFVANYWNACNSSDVVSGGIRNPAGPCPRGCELRYNYEHHAEQIRTLAWRRAHPFSAFSAFNVMISKSVFTQVRFDEHCRHYGYEDALMGLNLQNLGFSITHIDNPLVHLGIDSNESFLKKTETAMQTLYALGAPMTDVAGPSRLCKKLSRYKLDGLVSAFFDIFGPLMRRILLGRHSSVFLLNAYKLGYYCKLSR